MTAVPQTSSHSRALFPDLFFAGSLHGPFRPPPMRNASIGERQKDRRQQRPSDAPAQGKEGHASTAMIRFSLKIMASVATFPLSSKVMASTTTIRLSMNVMRRRRRSASFEAHAPTVTFHLSLKLTRRRRRSGSVCRDSGRYTDAGRFRPHSNRNRRCRSRGRSRRPQCRTRR